MTPDNQDFANNSHHFDFLTRFFGVGGQIILREFHVTDNAWFAVKFSCLHYFIDNKSKIFLETPGFLLFLYHCFSFDDTLFLIYFHSLINFLLTNVLIYVIGKYWFSFLKILFLKILWLPLFEERERENSLDSIDLNQVTYAESSLNLIFYLSIFWWLKRRCFKNIQTESLEFFWWVMKSEIFLISFSTVYLPMEFNWNLLSLNGFRIWKFWMQNTEKTHSVMAIFLVNLVAINQSFVQTSIEVMIALLRVNMSFENGVTNFCAKNAVFLET